MSQLRYDPLSRRWVIIATERARRPHDFKSRADEPTDLDKCPFCPGREEQTPPEIDSIHDRENRWQIRVTNNKFPALSAIDFDTGETSEGLYRSRAGTGAHEVIIETPDHNLKLPDLPPDHAYKLFKMYQTRLAALLDDNRLKYVLIFKNHGSTAGASLSHPHSQIIATPITPRTVQIELVAAQDHYMRFSRCLICDLIQQEIDSGSRVVYNDGKIIAFNSYAARFPFELFIAPINHHTRYEIAPDDVIESLSRCMQSVLGRLRDILSDPPYNFMLHSAPNTDAPPVFPGYWESLDKDFHWHIEVIPRLTLTAGFEWGSGLHINPTPPEDAAKFLNQAAG